MLTQPCAEALAEAEKIIAGAPHVTSERYLAEGYDYLAGSVQASLRLAWAYQRDFPYFVQSTGPYTKLGLDEFPNIDFPVVIVTTRLPGAAPEEVETDVTDKIEGAVSTISGIDELNSRSSEGVSLVVITFALEKNIDVAAQDVRDHINGILPELPKGIDLPIVGKVDPDAVLPGHGPVADLLESADRSGIRPAAELGEEP